MPSLKEYRDRIKSVKSTKKITSAMKMVAAAKLKKAQQQAEAGQPYAREMRDMLARVAANLGPLGGEGLKLMSGTGQDHSHLLIVVSAERGLCGGFNAQIVRQTRHKVAALKHEGKQVQIVCVGRKAGDILRREFPSLVLKHFPAASGQSGPAFRDAQNVADYVLHLFDDGQFDVAHLLYNEFHSILTQQAVEPQLIPFSMPEQEGGEEEEETEQNAKNTEAQALYSFEPDEETILQALLPRNITVQIYRALLDNAAGEQAARMTAMDNATRNAGDMIGKLTLQYNRARQAYITKELIEIISGAEAL